MNGESSSFMFKPGIVAAKPMLASLRALVDQRFDNGDRIVVPVLGSGVNLQAANEVGASALHWERLLGEIEAREGVTWERSPPHSMTARWEAMLQRQSDQRASEHEAVLIHTVIEALDDQTESIWQAAGGKAPPLYHDLLSKGFRDLVNLNFDDRLMRACDDARLFRAVAPKGMTFKKGTSFSVLPQLYQRYHRALPNFARLWHPHGRIRSKTTMVLGVGGYGRLIPDLDTGWRRYKAIEREFCHSKWRKRELFPEPRSRRDWSDEQAHGWMEHRRAIGPFLDSGALARRMAYRRPHQALSWLDVFLMSPLLFIGVGLGSDEFPLWWALHQRARNMARQPVDARAPAVLLTVSDDPVHSAQLDHLRGGPSGLCTVVFDSWDELWGWVRSI